MRIRVADWWRDRGERERRALLNEWDPIGVMHSDRSPLDEYNQHLGQKDEMAARIVDWWHGNVPRGGLDVASGDAEPA